MEKAIDKHSRGAVAVDSGGMIDGGTIGRDEFANGGIVGNGGGSGGMVKLGP